MSLVVQLNGKKITFLELLSGEQSWEICERAAALSEIKEALGERPIRKVIHVPGKVVNVVA